MDGTPFGRYRLIELLGRGGMGEVWRAFDTGTERVVALKVLPAQLADDETYQQRFRREARSAAGLDEPHVVPIYDFGEIEGRLFVTMRLIVGRDLQSMLREGPLDPARAVHIIDQVASALNAAHRIDLVHRDVKPSNILVAEDDFAYLIDFGIARSAGETSLTSTGNVIGSWAYLAPERMTRDSTDHRADIYALTCVMHECLTGSQPFPGDSLEQQLGGHLTQPPPRPSVLRHGLPAQLDAVVAKGMAKNPDDRYDTTRELTLAARAAITGPLARPQPAPSRPEPPNPRPMQSGPIPSGPGYQPPRPAYPPPPQQHTPPPYAPNPAQFQPAPFTGGYGGPPPFPSAQRSSNRTWVWVAVAAAVVVVVIVGVIGVAVGTGSDDTAASSGTSSTTTTTTTAPLVAPGALDGLLLTPDAVSKAMSTTGMTSSAGHHAITNNPYQVTPVECRFVDTVEADAFAGSGMTDSVEEQVSEKPTYHWVDQAAARFPSAQAAAAYVTAAQAKWQACASKSYTVTKPSGEAKPWSAGPVSSINGTLRVTVTGGNWRCQQALTAVNNIVANVQACNANLTDEGVRIAEQIAAKVPK